MLNFLAPPHPGGSGHALRGPLPHVRPGRRARSTRSQDLRESTAPNKAAAHRRAHRAARTWTPTSSSGSSSGSATCSPATSASRGARVPARHGPAARTPSARPSSWSPPRPSCRDHLGVTVGIVSALRQYSGFDYGIIFLSFLLYSLPSFWVAVLLKQWGAIGFNDFLKDPVIAWSVIAGIAVVAGLFWSLAVGGRAGTPLAGLRGRRRRDVRDVRLPAALRLVGASADRPDPAADPRRRLRASPSPRCSPGVHNRRAHVDRADDRRRRPGAVPARCRSSSTRSTRTTGSSSCFALVAIGGRVPHRPPLRRSGLGHLRAHGRRGGVHHRRR